MKTLLRFVVAFLRWLFDPMVFVNSVRSEYRKPFLLALGVFFVFLCAGSVLALTGAYCRKSGLPGSCGLSETYLGKKVAKLKYGHKAFENLHIRFDPKAIQGDIGNMPDEAKEALKEAMKGMSTYKPSINLSEVLFSIWWGWLWGAIVATLLPSLLGILFGLFPLFSLATNGIDFGVFFTRLIGPGTADCSILGLLIMLPFLGLFIPALLLSCAVGFEGAPVMLRSNMAERFKRHIRSGFWTWSFGVAPLIALGLIVQGILFYGMVLLTGNPEIYV